MRTMLKDTQIIPAALLLAALVLAGCGGTDEASDKSAPSHDSQYSYKWDGSGANVDKSQFGEDWPLTLKNGRVNCNKVSGGGVEAVFTSDDNKRYALNGTAKGYAQESGYLMVDKIWVDNPDIEGAKKDIGVLIDVCKPMM